jgi:ParB-like nuclease domain
MSKPEELGNYPIREIALSGICDFPGDRMRKLDANKVAEIAKSMEEVGLIQPVTVRPQPGLGYYLIAGQHRLHAAKKLKWQSIKCHVRDDIDDDTAKLIEIDENLLRAELTTEEKREHLLKRKEIWERRQAAIQVAHHAPDGEKRTNEGTFEKGNVKPKGFAADTTAATGLSKSQINRLLAEPKPKSEPKDLEAIEAEQRQRLVRVYRESLPVVQRWFRIKIGAER